MFETIDDPEETLRVPGWLWNLCVRLYRSDNPVTRAAATGLIVNRANSPDTDQASFNRIQHGYRAWVDALTEAELGDLERALGIEVCRVREWLSRLIRDGFPEGELVAFAVAREMLEAASCALKWRHREAWIRGDLRGLDRAVEDTLEAYAPPRSRAHERIFVPRRSGLLEIASARDEYAWWSQLVKLPPQRRKRRF